MRHRASRPVIDVWHRLPRAAARPLAALAAVTPVRALVGVALVLCLGTGAYVTVAAMTGPSDGEGAGTAALDTRPGLSVSRDGVRPGLTDGPTGSAGPETREPGSRPSTPATDASATSRADLTGSQVPSSLTPIGSPAPRLTADGVAGASTTGSPEPSVSTSDRGASSAPPEDETPPSTSVSAEFPQGDTALFSFTADEPASFTCSLDGSAYTACDSPKAYSALAPGWHTFAVRATDSSGNTDPSPAEVRWHARPAPEADS